MKKIITEEPFHNGAFVCFLEEASAEEMLRVVIPKLTNIEEERITFITFEGKRDLKKQIGGAMANYPVPNCVFLVMCDKDLEDCMNLKKTLLEKIEGGKNRAKVRIACHELESFYLGDLKAVEEGVSVPNLAKWQNKKIYRDPDARPEPDKLLVEITKNKYQKTTGSRSIAPHLDLSGGNCSKSFNALLGAIKELSAILEQEDASA